MIAPTASTYVIDPLQFCKLMWPDVYLYDKQREVVYSAMDTPETFVSAGNMLGKDFVSAFIVLWFFLSRHPCRVLTTSADYSQLESVLWGEIGRFINTSKYPLTVDRGGPLKYNHMDISKLDPGNPNVVCELSYIKGRVAAKGEGMLGHHIAETGDGIPRTLFVADEASGVDDMAYERSDTWAKRKLIIGNPYPCTTFFKRCVQGGDVLAK